MSPQRREVVLVPTAGRSGAAVVVRLLQSRGWVVPAPEVPADLENLYGYAEPAWVVATHRSWLARLPLTANPARADHAAQAAGVVTEEDLAAVQDWLQQTTSRHPRIVVKDPRLSWFLETWLTSARRTGVTAHVVHAVRHPAAVVTSKARAYGTFTSDEVRARQWVLSVLAPTQHDVPQPRWQVIDVQAALAEPEATSRRLCDGLGGDDRFPRLGSALLVPAGLSPHSDWPDDVTARTRDLAETVYDAALTADRDALRRCRAAADRWW